MLKLSQEEASKRITDKGLTLISKYQGSREKVTVRCVCGNIFDTTYKKILEGHTRSCGCIQRYDLIGKRFGRWIVEKSTSNKHGQRCWVCRCDCGTVRNVMTHSLVSGVSLSCGCLRQEILTGANSSTWKGYKDLTGSRWSQIRASAKARNIEFSIDISYAYDILVLQDFKCALTSVPIELKSKTASLDRIDSTKGYIIGNVQWVHTKVNRLKMDLSEQELLYWCKLLVENANAH